MKKYFIFAITGTVFLVGASSLLIIKNKTKKPPQLSQQEENFSVSYPEKKPNSSQVFQEKEKEKVPLPRDEDIINNWVNLIEEGRPEEAAQMMKISDSSPPQANSELQAWATHFSNINSFKLISVEKANESKWTETKHIYKVILDVWMNPDSASAPIPYYGWENGQNTRWLTLEKVGNTWKIAEIATGP